MISWPHNTAEHARYREFLLARGAAAVTEQAHILVWMQGNELLWVVAYDQWCGKTCQMHWASKSARFLPRKFIFTGFDYPFRILDIKRIFGQVNSQNAVALKMDLWFGFREVYRAEGCHNKGGDIIFLEMRADECKWIKEAK